MNKQIVVVGVNGFVGKHLAREISSQGHKVIGVGMDADVSTDIDSVVHKYVQCDFTKPESIARLDLDNVDAIINLAGLTNVGNSFSEAEAYIKVNVIVHTNIAEYIRSIDKKVRIVAVSTGAVYNSSQPMPLNENSELTTNGSPYAMSKIAMENALQEYIDSGSDIIIARPFNHIGPGQLKGFLVPDLSEQVQSSDELTVGNLETERDYTDVRDVVKAYVKLALLQDPQHRLYNICSGKSVKGSAILEIIKDKLGKNNLKISVDPSRIRSSDPPLFIGDSSRLGSETGWAPTIELDQTIQDYLDSAFKS